MKKTSRNGFPPGAAGNRLGSEKSPYLLQHAGNPVHWWPWCREAFDLAKRQDKPVFLSIGYATCHWCHVMEKESFEDEEVAAFLNAHFVAVKVDREERPDVDALYMEACQLMTGGGGWPLNVLLTPEKKPFYAATYIPRHAVRGHPGIIPLLTRIVALWQEDRLKIEENGDLVSRHLKEAGRGTDTAGPISDEPLLIALKDYSKDFDAENGGFSGAPKFPMSHNLLLLLRLHERYGDEKALAMVAKTLKKIRAGGIYDQLGFGIHRYAVDAAWQIPHFEKMLYDQALFVIASLEAYQASGDGAFAEMAAETLGYLDTSLRHPDGGFWCGEDADSEGAEGSFYLWDRREILSLLGDAEGERFCRLMGVSGEGNFEGRNILHRPEMAPLSEEERIFLEGCRKRLLAVRSQRVRPFLDDKILTSWNGLAIAAFAKAGAILGENGFTETAQRAAQFVFDRLYDQENSRLLRRWREGEAAIQGFLEDYSFFCWGLVELYMACFDPLYLEKAHELTEEMLVLFGDGKDGFFDTGSDGETILTRGINRHDSALPAGNSVAVLNLLRLAELSADRELREKGVRGISRLFGEMAHVPLAYPFLLLSLDWVLGPTSRVTLTAAGGVAETASLIGRYHAAFLPRSTLFFQDQAQGQGRPGANVTPPSHGAPTAQVCREGTCFPPTNDAEIMLAQLKGVFRHDFSGKK
ncbi:MAG: thioredoxin domain-containing protein [Desulfuromonadaceae bacterium]|nr:thioredoxin domain-containing protein [Desulfuromonadaceae bacterium]